MVADLAARLKRTLLATLAIAIAAGAADAQPRGTLGPPALAADGSVIWGPARLDSPPWLTGLVLPPRTPADSLAVWTRVAERDSLLRPFALLTVGRIRQRLGDVSGADSLFAAGAALPGPWNWSLAQARLESWRARWGAEQTLRLFDTMQKQGWTEAEVAASLLARMRLRLELGDTSQARSTALALVRLAPSTTSARSALALFEGLAHAQGDSLTRQDEWEGAQVDRFAGLRSSGERRLTRALRLPEAADDDPKASAEVRRSAMALRLAEFRRLLRLDAGAEQAIAIALTSARDANERAAALLERARTLQARGLLDSALTMYQNAADTADSTRREPFLLELARELERAGRWSAAREALQRVASGAKRESATDATFRIGILHFVEGRLDSAVARWEGMTSEAATFWHATGLRAMARAQADSSQRRSLTSRADRELRTLGARPGYSFYRAAARETLAIAGWTRSPVLAPAATPRAVESARTLAALGMTVDAANLLSRWNAGDARLAAYGAPTPEGRIAAAQLAYAIGSVPLGIGIADRAARELEDSLDERAWSAQPWLYPPSFDSLARLRPADLEPAMVMGVMRQESRFDPRARSSSDALGLMQLKLSTARDVQRRLREKGALTEEKMFEPARNVRYGAAYLAQLEARFGGGPAVALSAYNAGPGTIPAYVHDLRARGGDALFCEIASNATAQDYARKILGNRAAYRELAPRSR